MTRPDVFAVYVQLPSNKAPMGVVEQPDGSYAFADARQQQQQEQYAAPAPYGTMAYRGSSGGGGVGQQYQQPAAGYPTISRE